MQKTLAVAPAVLAISLLRAQGNVPDLPEGVPESAAYSSILFSGNKAGDQAVWKTPEGAIRVFYQFNDRGRGPKLESTYRLSERGLPAGVVTTGTDYFKNPVDDHFTLDGTRASWNSTAETGEEPDAAGKFFLGLNSPTEELAMLARALLHNGNRLRLLPAGEATLERAREIRVTAGARSIDVVLYAVSGLDFSPTHLWLDKEEQLFAAGTAWSMLIRRGWETVGRELVQAQTAVAGARYGVLAARLTGRPAGDVVFRDVNVFDTDAGEIKKGQDVVVRGDRIRKVGPSPIKVAKKATVIDGRGKTLLPGLWDMHVHMGADDGLLDIAAGVTSVRDLANDIDKLAAQSARYEAGTEIGPRIIAAGIIDGPGPYQGPTKVLADTEAAARAAVARYADLGYPQIKIYSSLKPELVPVIIEAAHRRGMRVSGHIPATMTAEDCIRLGLDEIQHMNFVMLNFMPDVKETRTPARFIEPAGRGADLDVRSERVQAFIRLLQERNIVVDPTLGVFEQLFVDRPGQVRIGLRSVAQRLPVQVQRGLKTGGLPVPEGMDARYRASFETMKKLLKEMYDGGVWIVAGTDDLAGFSLHRELEIYAEAGIPAPDILRLATIKSAKLMKKDRELGSITTGRLADLILVDGDPSRNIGDVRRTTLVMKDGLIFDPAQIYSSLGVSPQ